MITLLASVARVLGPTVCTALGLLAWYEGLPGLRDMPFIDRVPVVRELIVGRVQIEKARAVDAALEGYVTRAELAASQARAAELERQARIATFAASAAQQQAATARADAEAARVALEEAISNETDDRAARWGEYDLERLRQHGLDRPQR